MVSDPGDVVDVRADADEDVTWTELCGLVPETLGYLVFLLGAVFVVIGRLRR